MKIARNMICTTMGLLMIGTSTQAFADGHSVSDNVISEQRGNLASSTKDAGFGPQSPRNLDSVDGQNQRSFGTAPPYAKMNLCNIHFHENAEHKGGEFAKFVGNGDGKGKDTGFVYSGELSAQELTPFPTKIGDGKYGDLQSGDTIELHYVYSTAQVEPGPTLGACLSEAIKNPQLRVETQVYVLVNDEAARDFVQLNKHTVVNGFHQAVNKPKDTGKPIVYEGSTTGPAYNEVASPFQVTWSVRPEVAKVSIASVDAWLKNNIFKETHAHGVRNLVTNPQLLSPIN